MSNLLFSPLSRPSDFILPLRFALTIGTILSGRPLPFTRLSLPLQASPHIEKSAFPDVDTSGLSFVASDYRLFAKPTLHSNRLNLLPSNQLGPPLVRPSQNYRRCYPHLRVLSWWSSQLKSTPHLFPSQHSALCPTLPSPFSPSVDFFSGSSTCFLFIGQMGNFEAQLTRIQSSLDSPPQDDCASNFVL